MEVGTLVPTSAVAGTGTVTLLDAGDRGERSEGCNLRGADERFERHTRLASAASSSDDRDNLPTTRAGLLHAFASRARRATCPTAGPGHGTSERGAGACPRVNGPRQSHLGTRGGWARERSPRVPDDSRGLLFDIGSDEARRERDHLLVSVAGSYPWRALVVVRSASSGASCLMADLAHNRARGPCLDRPRESRWPRGIRGPDGSAETSRLQIAATPHVRSPVRHQAGLPRTYHGSGGSDAVRDSAAGMPWDTTSRPQHRPSPAEPGLKGFRWERPDLCSRHSPVASRGSVGRGANRRHATEAVLLDPMARSPPSSLVARPALAASKGVYGTTASRDHWPGMPLSSCRPRSRNSMPDPTVRSRTVLDASTSPAPLAP